MNPVIYRHSRVLAAPSQRATPDEALVIDRLATKAVALAQEHGEVLTRRDAIIRARANLAWAKSAAENSR